MSEIDLFHPDFFANPYPTYTRLRDEQPVYWDERAQRWFIMRYADVVAATIHPGVSAARIPPTARIEAAGLGVMEPVYAMMRQQMTFLDPPDHTRIRGLVHKAFSPSVVTALRGHIQTIADELLAPFEGAGGFDLIKDFAFPLPAIVIAKMLGVRPEDRDQFKTWSTDIAELVGNPARPMARLLEIKKSTFELVEYLRAAMIRLRRSPEDNLMSALAQAEDAGSMLTEDELLANAVFVLVAGHETTTNLIANGILSLIRAPEAMATLRGDASRYPAAIEEMLRFESPLQMVGRVAREDLEIGGTEIKKGQVLALGLGSANHDPTVFDDPDRLDLARKDNKHLAFNQGAHYCIGAALARIEGQIAISSVLRSAGDLRLERDDVPLEWNHNLSFRGLRSLPVLLR
ncbi:MAG: cytochrome P450 [Byssovorax sp.]